MNADPLGSGSTTVQQTGQEAELGHFSTYSVPSLWGRKITGRSGDWREKLTKLLTLPTHSRCKFLTSFHSEIAKKRAKFQI
jgi:hypothetical protein